MRGDWKQIYICEQYSREMVEPPNGRQSRATHVSVDLGKPPGKEKAVKDQERLTGPLKAEVQGLGCTRPCIISKRQGSLTEQQKGYAGEQSLPEEI